MSRWRVASNKAGGPVWHVVIAGGAASIVMGHCNGHTVLGTVQSLLCVQVDFSVIIIMGLQGLLNYRYLSITPCFRCANDCFVDFINLISKSCLAKDRGRGQPWGFGKGVWGVGVRCWPFRPPRPPGSGGVLTKHAVITIYSNII